MQKSGYGKLSFKSINNKVAAVNLMGYTHTDMIAMCEDWCATL